MYHETATIQLGAHVKAIRDKDELVYGRSDRRKQLTDLGFVWEDDQRMIDSRRRFETVYEALACFKSIYHHLSIPRSFVVPNADPWPLVNMDGSGVLD